VLTYRIEPAKRLVVFTASGHLTAAEVLSVQDQLRVDPNFDPVFSLLADYLQITGSDFDSSNLLDMARNAPFGPTARTLGDLMGAQQIDVHRTSSFGRGFT
jgi:hypothetical protein